MSVWEIVELARHPQRPYSLDYIHRLAPDFIELHGDRLSADDPALVAGVGTWHGRTTMFFGHQKGRTVKERVERNWGMMHPEGYRKAEAAEQLQLTSREIVGMGVVEEVVPEPVGSASADYDGAAKALDAALHRQMEPLLEMRPHDLMQHRYERFRYIDSLIRAEPGF